MTTNQPAEIKYHANPVEHAAARLVLAARRAAGDAYNRPNVWDLIQDRVLSAAIRADTLPAWWQTITAALAGSALPMRDDTADLLDLLHCEDGPAILALMRDTPAVPVMLARLAVTEARDASKAAKAAAAEAAAEPQLSF